MSKTRKKRTPKRVLALPDLEQAKSAVLNTLTSVSGQRTYDHALNDFVEWYCSEPRLAPVFRQGTPLRPRVSMRPLRKARVALRISEGPLRPDSGGMPLGRALAPRSRTVRRRGKNACHPRDRAFHAERYFSEDGNASPVSAHSTTRHFSRRPGLTVGMIERSQKFDSKTCGPCDHPV